MLAMAGSSIPAAASVPLHTVGLPAPAQLPLCFGRAGNTMKKSP